MATGAGYIQYLLRLLFLQEAIASVYTDASDPDGFFAGYIQGVDARHYLMAEINPWGRMDGWRVRRVQDIVQILAGEDYEARLSVLLKHHGEQPKPLMPVAEQEDADILYLALQKCMEDGRMISIINGEDILTGRVVQVDQLRTKIRGLNFFGVPEAEDTQFLLRDIEMLSIDSGEERMYEELETMGMTQLRLLGKDERGQDE